METEEIVFKASELTDEEETEKLRQQEKKVALQREKDKLRAEAEAITGGR